MSIRYGKIKLLEAYIRKYQGTLRVYRFGIKPVSSSLREGPIFLRKVRLMVTVQNPLH